MTTISARIRSAEKRLKRIGRPKDALIMAPISRGTFTAADLDELFQVIHSCFRAATLATAVLLAEAGRIYNRPGTVLGDFALYVGQSSIKLIEDRETNLMHCKQTLIRAETVKDPFLLPEIDNRNRVLRGLSQRLATADGLEELGELIEFGCTSPMEEWPLPVLSSSERDRIVDLVSPLHDRDDYRMILWRNRDGTPGWDYRNRETRR